MKTGLQLSFIEKSIDPSFYLEIFNRFLNFTPYGMGKGYKTQAWDEKKFRKYFLKLKTSEGITVYDLKGNIISGGQTGSKIPFTSITIEQDQALFSPGNAGIESLSEGENFVTAYLYDSQYVEVQSTSNINNLKHKDIPEELYSTLKGTPFKHDLFGYVAYDTQYNPGRKDLISYTWLMAAWKMWFGNTFFELVPKERILSFKDAFEIRELVNGYVYVQLFEKLEESHTIQNMQKQQQFRDWLGYNDLIKKYS